MGLRLDDDDVAVAAATPTLEFPRHAKVDHDHKVHTFDEFYEQTTKAEEPHGEGAGEELEEEDENDEKPLLQEIKVPRTSSQKRVKNATVKGKTESNGKTNATMVSVTSSQQSQVSRLRGLGYIVFAALNFSVMSVCIKFATHHVTSHEAVFWRTLLSWLLNISLIRLNKVSLYVAPVHRKLLLFRCFIGMMCISFSYYAVSKMVLTDATVIIFTSPVLTFLLGSLVLGETIERADFACALVSYIGVFFVARPAMLFPQDASTKKTDTFAVFCALMGAATQAGAYIAMRKLHDVHYMVVSHYFSFFGIFFSLLTLWSFGVPLRVPEAFSVQLALFGSALFSCIGLLLLTLGFQIEKAGIASVMRYFDVVFVFILDTTLLGEDVNGYSVLGGAIILCGAIVIAIRRARAKK